MCDEPSAIVGTVLDSDRQRSPIWYRSAMDRNNLQLRTVIFREGEWWVAQCLDFDIATQAKTLKDLAYELQRVLVGHMVVCRQEGITPFVHLPKAPEKYWDMFSEGLELSAPQNFKLQLDTNVSVPTPELHLVG